MRITHTGQYVIVTTTDHAENIQMVIILLKLWHIFHTQKFLHLFSHLLSMLRSSCGRQNCSMHFSSQLSVSFTLVSFAFVTPSSILMFLESNTFLGCLLISSVISGTAGTGLNCLETVEWYFSSLSAETLGREGVFAPGGRDCLAHVSQKSSNILGLRPYG